MKKTYHVFTDHKDEYVDTLKRARELFKSFKKDYRCARVYRLVEDEENGNTEDCIMSYGEYPY